MIEITRLNGEKCWVNPHQIEMIEMNPDVTLVMLSGKKILVREKPEEIKQRILDYRCRIAPFKNEL